MSLLSLRFLSPFAPLGWLILRLVAGVVLALHGYYKMKDGVGGFAENLATKDVPLPEVSAWLSVGAELVGGAFLALGLFTRPVGLVIAFNFFVAIWLMHREDLATTGQRGGGADPAVLFLAIGLAALFMGGGKFSVDAIFQRRPSLSPPPTR